MIQTLYDDIREILRDDMDKALHDMLDYYAAMFMCDIRASSFPTRQKPAC